MVTKLHLKGVFNPEGADCYINYPHIYENAMELFFSSTNPALFNDASVKSGDCDSLINQINMFTTARYFGEPICVITDYLFISAENYLNNPINPIDPKGLSHSKFVEIVRSEQENSSNQFTSAQCGQDSAIVKMVELFQNVNTTCAAYVPEVDKLAYLDGHHLVVENDFVISAHEAKECIGETNKESDSTAEL